MHHSEIILREGFGVSGSQKLFGRQKIQCQELSKIEMARPESRVESKKKNRKGGSKAYSDWMLCIEAEVKIIKKSFILEKKTDGEAEPYKNFC